MNGPPEDGGAAPRAGGTGGPPGDRAGVRNRAAPGAGGRAAAGGGEPGTAGARDGRGRRLAWVCVALLAAAGALAGASALAWYIADVPAVGRAPVRVVARGADVVAGLHAAALLAVAAVAAVVALAGAARRVLGAVLVLVAAWLTWALARAVAAPPTGTEIAALPGAPAGAGIPAGPAAPIEVAATAAPLLAGAGVLLLATAGLVTALREPLLARFGARYATAGARRAELDPDRAAWDALDAGRDPTDP